MKISIIGATGLVGREIIKILSEKNLINGNTIYLYASEKSAGKKLKVGSKFLKVMPLSLSTILPCDFALFSAGSLVSKMFAKEFTKKGAFVIDNSSAFRRKNNVPLVVPQINGNTITNKTKIIACPNCSTIGLVLPLFCLLKHAEIERIVVSTYQAVSGAGKKAIEDLNNGTTKKLNEPIKNNLIPQIDHFLYSGNTFEEDKMIYETQKILNRKINISSTCVRVPIQNCHSESVNITFNKPFSAKMAKNLLKNGQKIELLPLPMPTLANGSNNVFVGRIRKDYSFKNTLNMFLCFDNLRVGASLNVVSIMEYIILNKINGN